MTDVLLIEDNEAIGEGLKYSFEQNGYAFTICKTRKEAIEYLSSHKPTIIILDITLPDGNGFDLYQSLIKEMGISTIFLTAMDDEEDVVKGLTLGAEDYMTKPFSSKELMARVSKIVLRKKNQTLIKVQDITFDMGKMEVYKDNKKLDVSSLELKILHLLFLNINHVVRRATILDKIWEWTGNDVDDHTITVYLKRIREKLGSDIIITIKGIGYRIDEK